MILAFYDDNYFAVFSSVLNLISHTVDVREELQDIRTAFKSLENEMHTLKTESETKMHKLQTESERQIQELKTEVAYLKDTGRF